MADPILATAPSLQLAVDFVGDLTERAQELNSEFETLMEDVANGGDLTEHRIKVSRYDQTVGVRWLK